MFCIFIYSIFITKKWILFLQSSLKNTAKGWQCNHNTRLRTLCWKGRVALVGLLGVTEHARCEAWLYLWGEKKDICSRLTTHIWYCNPGQTILLDRFGNCEPYPLEAVPKGSTTETCPASILPEFNLPQKKLKLVDQPTIFACETKKSSKVSCPAGAGDG